MFRARHSCLARPSWDTSRGPIVIVLAVLSNARAAAPERNLHESFMGNLKRPQIIGWIDRGPAGKKISEPDRELGTRCRGAPRRALSRNATPAALSSSGIR